MMINILLEEIIQISQKTKTDFALHMNMTPSGLSKILSSKTLPSIKERNNFTQQSADYFAEAIYSQACYLKFENLFPVIYDFDSLEELRGFLIAAITYALDTAYIERSNLNLTFNDRAMYYLGKNLTTNQLCIILSDYAIKFSDENLEFFISLPLTNPSFFKVFKRILLIGFKKTSKIILNYYFNEDLINGPNRISTSNLLLLISYLNQYFDLNFYQVDGHIDFFILLKGQLLLSLNMQIDSIPLLFPILNKGYLSIFYNSLLKKGAKKISYNINESIKFLTENPQFIFNLLEEGIESVYNFTHIGYLLTHEELMVTESNSIICDAMSELFNGILVKQPAFIVSLSATSSFSSFGNVIVPLVGTTTFTPEHRNTYMQRFNDYLYADSYNKLKIIDSDLTNIAILFSKNLCLIYATDNTIENEKTHAFQGTELHNQFYRELVESNSLVTDFSVEIWDSYRDKLKHITDEIIRSL